MQLQKTSLSESVNLFSIKTDKFKTGIITFTLTTPLSAKNFAYNAVLAGVLRRGTQKYPSMSSLNRALDELYASSIEIRSTKNGSNLSLTITAEFLDTLYIPDNTDILGGVLDIIEQFLLYPILNENRFDDAVVTHEIRTSLDYLNSEINNTRLYSLKRCNELMYRFDLEYPSTEKQKEYISTINGGSLYEHYKSIITSASLDVFYVGNESIEAVKSKIPSAILSIGAKNQYAPINPLTRPKLDFVSASQQMPVSQGKLTMGFNTNVCIDGTDEYLTMLLLNELFGASPSSKLFINVREKMSLCYYCSSTYNIYSGDMIVSSGIEVKNREKTEREISVQLDNIQKGIISEYELSSAKKSLENSYRQLYDNPLDLQAFYGIRSMFAINETIESTIKKISEISANDITKAANKITLDTVFFVEGTSNQSDTEDDYND